MKSEDEVETERQTRMALVTGSAGFIGRHLLPKLESAGYVVCAFDPKNQEYRAGLYAQKIETAILEHSIVYPIDRRFDVIVHLAAHIPDISERMNGGLHQYQDIALDWAMANYVKEYPPRECFIVPSSCAIDSWETDPYAYVKMTAERFWTELHKAGVPTVVLRPYSGYGADQADTYPFPAILKRALQHENPLTVWGHGHQVRDFIHVDDLTNAFLWAIENAPRGIPIEIGTGLGTTFLELARQMAEAVGYSPYICGDICKPTSSLRRVADTTLAKAHGFEAKISLAEGIRLGVDVLQASRTSA